MKKYLFRLLLLQVRTKLVSHASWCLSLLSEMVSKSILIFGFGSLHFLCLQLNIFHYNCPKLSAQKIIWFNLKFSSMFTPLKTCFDNSVNTNNEEKHSIITEKMILQNFSQDSKDDMQGWVQFSGTFDLYFLFLSEVLSKVLHHFPIQFMFQ